MKVLIAPPIKEIKQKVFKSLLQRTNEKEKNYKLFAIDMKWFNRWKTFIINDLDGKIIPNNEKYISDNKLLGVLVYAFPFFLINSIWLLYTLYMCIGGVFALYSSVETNLIHIVVIGETPLKYFL